MREAAKRDKGFRFTTLLHHVNEGLLLDSFYLLRKQAAPGVDQVTWGEYEQGVEERIKDLHGGVHRGASATSRAGSLYLSGDKVTGAASPQGQRSPHGESTSRNRMAGNGHSASRRWKTRSCNRLDQKRSLQVALSGDKVCVASALVVKTVLSQIYEADFLGISYGFRPGRGAQDGLDAITAGIITKKVNWILDAAIRGFFDNISHEKLIELIELRVADQRIVRLIRKWLKAGVSEEGQWSETKVETPDHRRRRMVY